MSRASILREQARELLERAKAADAAERRAIRKLRDRAAYVVGGYLIRHRVTSVQALLGNLSPRDRSLVESVLPVSESTPNHPSAAPKP